jgi:hypothetical protein
MPSDPQQVIVPPRAQRARLVAAGGGSEGGSRESDGVAGFSRAHASGAALELGAGDGVVGALGCRDATTGPSCTAMRGPTGDKESRSDSRCRSTGRWPSSLALPAINVVGVGVVVLAEGELDERVRWEPTKFLQTTRQPL